MNQKATSNTDFGRRVGVHFTMASRLRNGHRVPSPQTMLAIKKAFSLTADEVNAMLEAADTPDTFGVWARANLFEEAVTV
jgi:transcriptional regulator with XRE-family HTH domain